MRLFCDFQPLCFRLELLTECEAHPDKWFRGWARTKYEINLARAATFLGSDVKNLAFVTNPTTAINAIFNREVIKHANSENIDN